jgi:hypothetical protein
LLLFVEKVSASNSKQARAVQASKQKDQERLVVVAKAAERGKVSTSVLVVSVRWSH